MGFSQPTLAYYNGDAWESEVVNGEFAVFFVNGKSSPETMGFPWVFPHDI